MRGKNLAFNGFFDIEAADAEFPMGWAKANGDSGTTLAWSTDYAIVGNHSVRVINTTYTASFTGIVQDHRYSVDVRPAAVWELAAWMRTEQAGVPLRLVAVFMDAKWQYQGETALAFTSTTAMQRYSGTITVPADAVWLKVACGVHDTPRTLPSTLWISWVTLRELSQ